MPVPDTKQTRFDGGANLVQPRPATWEIKNHLQEVYSCPFCLAKGRLYRFVVYKADRSPSRVCKCFECGVKFYLPSLVSDMTLRGYAKWIANYPYAEFWRRCNFDVWVERLGTFGDTRPFWDAYRSEKAKRI